LDRVVNPETYFPVFLFTAQLSELPAQNMIALYYTVTVQDQVKSSQVTFIYIALFTIQIVSKQLHSDNM